MFGLVGCQEADNLLKVVVIKYSAESEKEKQDPVMTQQLRASSLSSRRV